MFKTFFKWLKPGGRVLITDYCKSDETPSPLFAEVIKQRGYDIHDVQAYGQVCVDNKTVLLFSVFEGVMNH